MALTDQPKSETYRTIIKINCLKTIFSLINIKRFLQLSRFGVFVKPVWVNGGLDPILVDTSQRVLDAILAAQVPVAMLCGGKGLCATCHVYVEEGADSLTPVTPRERMSLKMLYDVRPSSRLACQAKVTGVTVKVTVPKGRYLESAVSLDSLIGRRAEERILHPVNGRVLIEAGKIITRSRISELRVVDVDVAAMRQQSQSIKAL